MCVFDGVLLYYNLMVGNEVLLYYNLLTYYYNIIMNSVMYPLNITIHHPRLRFGL